MIRSREYRYLSPSFMHDPQTGDIKALRGAGLVHHPAFHLTAIASEETMSDTDNPTADLAPIIEALGLKADADIDAILGAIEALKTPDPKRYVPVEAVAEMLSDRNSQIATASGAEAERRVEIALASGYLTPAMRPWAVSLCRNDLASFDAFMAKAAPAYASLSKAIIPAAPPAIESHARDDQAAEIARNIGVDPGALTRR